MTPAGVDDRRYQRPESVLVVVLTAAGEALLLRRTRPSNFWQSVTGSLEWGEEPASAARRELLEETGIDARPVATGAVNTFPILPQWRNRYHPDVVENREYVYVVRLPARVTVRIDPDEHLEYDWLAGDLAATRASSWTNRDALVAALSRQPG